MFGLEQKKWDGLDWFLLLVIEWPYLFLRKWIRGIPKGD